MRYEIFSQHDGFQQKIVAATGAVVPSASQPLTREQCSRARANAGFLPGAYRWANRSTSSSVPKVVQRLCCVGGTVGCKEEACEVAKQNRCPLQVGASA